MSADSGPKKYKWSSNHEGWYSRARSHPSPQSIDYTKAKAILGSTYSAMGGSGFNLALFETKEDDEHVAVDAAGRAVILDPADAAAFKALAKESLGLPEREYRIKHLVTCRPFDIVKILAEDGKFQEFSVYGYSKTLRDLSSGGGQLPSALWELYGLVEEAKSPGGKEEVNQQVLKAVESVF